MDRVTFKVNGNKYTAGGEVDSEVHLVEYLRENLKLRGTKKMCKEGGCGACVVAVTATDPVSGHPRTFSINSCLVQVLQCQDWSIRTVEGIGGRRQGYHPISRALAETNGSQCGYCSVGWVMSMYSLLESNNYDVTQYQVEDSFGSNVCRCTGYRPILDAFKSFAKDAPPHLKNITDIEDMGTYSRNCNSPCNSDMGWCLINKEDVTEKHILKINLKDDRVWYRVNDVNEIFEIFNVEGTASYMLVVGNTGKGAVPILEYPRVLIDINSVEQLKKCYIDQNLVIGAGTALTDVMDIFQRLAAEKEEFKYLEKLREHIDLVAHIPVRNIGSIGGNLMVKHRDNSFSSDLFLLSECVGAMLTIMDIVGSQFIVTLVQFLHLDMTGKVILDVKFPPLGSENKFVSFKIMARSQSAHAQVNEAVLYKFKPDLETIENARIVFGGLSPDFNHAYETEKCLIGKKVFTNNILQEALFVLENEIKVKHVRGDLPVEFKRKLAIGLFYKANITLIPEDRLKPAYRSGTIDLRKTRPLSKSSQVFDTNPIIWPVTEPYPKLDALIQCAGEARYSDDLPPQSQEVFAAFVTTTVSSGQIENIDPSPALKIPGVLQFFSAKDIPGINNFLSPKVFSFFTPEEVLCSGTVKYYDQPLGIIVAESDRLANIAVNFVNVKYKDSNKTPLLTVEDVKERDPSRISLFLAVPAKDRGADVQRVLKGTDNIYGQYWYTMETLQCLSRPSENGIELFPATQWPDATQQSVADVLNIPTNRVSVVISRLGGAYGCKISRNNLLSTASALVTFLMNRPCRFIMTIQATMRAIGKRAPNTRDFEVGVNDKGQVQYLEYHDFVDNGYVFTDQIIAVLIGSTKNCYDTRRWQFKYFNVTTDTASNSWMRSPGTLEAINMTEYIMERISYALDKDPFEVREQNLNRTDISTNIEEVIRQLKEDSEYYNRKEEVDKYNKNNRWKKRGLRIALMTWPTTIVSDYHIALSVFHGDGSISVSHGGVEMGQGVNTKVIQTVAYTLKISTDKVRVDEYNSQKNPNTITTGDSRTSEIVCLGAVKCCQILLDRLQVVRDALNDPTWEVLILAAHQAGINLQVSYQTTSNDVVNYKVSGGAVVETELDILTGEFDIRRADLVIDVGTSINPVIDLGQVEGSFIIGSGYWTTENLIYDKHTGELENDRTWNYYVPLVKDIPLDFRVKFLRNSYNTAGILGAKAVAEPPTVLGIAVGFSLRHAISASREDRGFPRTDFFQVDGPYTISTNLLSADVRKEEYLYN